MSLQSTYAKLKENHTSLAVMFRSILELLNRSKADSLDRAISKIKEVLERGVRFIDDQGSDPLQIQQLIGGIKREEPNESSKPASESKHLDS